MKQPRKPTRQEKESMVAQNLNPLKWAVLETSDFYMKVINKETNQIKRIDRYAKMKNKEDYKGYVAKKKGN